MTSGPGTTGKADVPPDEAIEEISGLLEMDELNPGESKAADGAEQPQADAAHVATPGVGDELHFSMETPGAVQVDSYLLPPPVSDESPGGPAPEPESASATNLAYEDLLEKLVLPTKPSASDENEAPEDPPPFASPRPSSSHSSSTPLASLFPPGAPSIADVSDERTVVTANPLLAEEQEAAAREAETYILPAASQATPVFQVTPVFVEPPVAAKPVRVAFQRTGLALNKVIQISYQKFGIALLAAMLVGGLLSRLMAPTRAVVSAPSAQIPTLVAKPVVPAQPTQAANPAPQVVALPTPSQSPPPAPAAAQPAAAAEARPQGEIPIAHQPTPVEPGAVEYKTAAKAKVHHVAKSPRPPKSAAPKVAPAKPAAPKKPAKGGWVDPFAQ
jgi:hypothetical protein